MAGRYTHAVQFKRARRALKFLRTRLVRIFCDKRQDRRQCGAHKRSAQRSPTSKNSPASKSAAPDKGLRDHNYANRYVSLISGQIRRVTKAIRPEMQRTAAVEPVIGHVKSDHRMRRNYFQGREGDRASAVLAAAGYNFGPLLRCLEELLRALAAAPPSSSFALLKSPLADVLHGRQVNDSVATIVVGRLARRQLLTTPATSLSLAVSPSEEDARRTPSSGVGVAK
jgi:hypothetical protein